MKRKVASETLLISLLFGTLMLAFISSSVNALVYYGPWADFTWTPAIPTAGEVVTFDASASRSRTEEGEVPIVQYDWDFGDGIVTSVTDPLITHTYASPGAYIVTLIVTDSLGRSLPYAYARRQKQIHVGFPILDDFSSDTELWRYLGFKWPDYWGMGAEYKAYRDATKEYIVLTPPEPHLAGVIWFKHEFTSPFTVSFSYLAGEGSGADGLVMMFYHEKPPYLWSGASLSFIGDGYGIEFDNYENYLDDEYGGPPITDPSGNHIALIKDNPSNHLVYVNDMRTEDNVWHDVTVTIGSSSITVYVDSEKVLEWEGEIDRTYGGFGFAGATGGLTNWHLIDNFSLTIMRPPSVQLKVGDIVETTNYLKVRDIIDWNNPLDPKNVLFIMPPPYRGRTSPPNNVGKIIDGPKKAGGYIWWKIEWDNGEEGWSAEGPIDNPDVKYLIKSDKSLVKFEDIEDPFNYKGQYTLNLDLFTSKEDEALKYVMTYAKIRKISPALIMAIISWESNFDANAKGDYRILYKGESKPTAFGYMQVRWPAAFDAGFRGKERKIDGALEEHYKWFNENCEKIWSVKPTLEKFFAYLDWPDKGLDPNQNIRYGSGYIKWLYDKYGDGLKNTVSGYNPGDPRYAIKILESDKAHEYRGYRHYLSIRNEKQPLSTVESKSPVDLIVTDPDNLTITKNIDEIPGVLYYLELDIDENGELDDMIVILKRKIGDYLIDVIPEPDAAPTDMYTLEMWLGNITIVLAENVEVNNIPLQPYIVRSLEAEIIPIIPATIDFDPDTLNLKSNGTWVTVYIELPIGHGYNVSMINLESVWLNSQVQAQVKPAEIGDYDDDGIPDLMIKFNRTAVQNILEVGEKVEITIFGELIDERLFEGKDIIQVIATP
jgi:hypothetical protein